MKNIGIRSVRNKILVEKKQTKYTVGIPLGMHRSVEWNNNDVPTHPVRDASLAGCKGGGVMAFFTERCIPNGILNRVSIVK